MIVPDGSDKPSYPCERLLGYIRDLSNIKMSCPRVMSSADKLSFQVRQDYLKAYYVKQVVTQLV